MCSVRHFPLTGAMDKTSSPAAGFTLKSEENHSPNCRQDKQALIFCSLTSSERRILYPDKTALHDSIYLFIFAHEKHMSKQTLSKQIANQKINYSCRAESRRLFIWALKTLSCWNISQRGRFQLILFTADWSFVGNPKKHKAFQLFVLYRQYF